MKSDKSDFIVRLLCAVAALGVPGAIITAALIKHPVNLGDAEPPAPAPIIYELPAPPSGPWQGANGEELLRAPKLEKRIAAGCSWKAEQTFYIAQQALYAGGNTQKLMAFLRKNMPEAEYMLKAPVYEQLSQWVAQHKFPTAHEYSRGLFYECVSASYKEMKVYPSELVMEHSQRFESILAEQPERPELEEVSA